MSYKPCACQKWSKVYIRYSCTARSNWRSFSSSKLFFIPLKSSFTVLACSFLWNWCTMPLDQSWHLPGSLLLSGSGSISTWAALTLSTSESTSFANSVALSTLWAANVSASSSKNGSQHFRVFLHCFLNNHLWYTLRHQFRHYISTGCRQNHGPLVLQTSKFFIACCHFV